MLKRILKYRFLIFQIIILLYKYIIIRHLLSDKTLLNYVSKKENQNTQNTILPKKQPYKVINSIINSMINHLYPNGNCLVKSLVKREVLQKNGYFNRILLGVQYSDNGIKAHAWLEGEKVLNYNVVYFI